MFRTLTAAAVLSVAAFLMPQAAHAEDWFCEVEQTNRSGFIPPQIAFQIRNDQPEVTFRWIDGEITTVTGSVSGNSAQRWAVNYTMRNVRSSNGQYATIVYQTSYQRGNGNFRVTARPAGYNNFFQASGSCRPM